MHRAKLQARDYLRKLLCAEVSRTSKSLIKSLPLALAQHILLNNTDVMMHDCCLIT